MFIVKLKLEKLLKKTIVHRTLAEERYTMSKLVTLNNEETKDSQSFSSNNDALIQKLKVLTYFMVKEKPQLE